MSELSKVVRFVRVFVRVARIVRAVNFRLLISSTRSLVASRKFWRERDELLRLIIE